MTIFHIGVETYNSVLRFYDDSKIKPLGIIRLQGRKKQLELFIIEDGTTALIGRQWLAELQIHILKLDCHFRLSHKT